MARIRYLKPEFFTDEDLATLPFETRLTYAGLWCYADKSGRLEDRPQYLKAMIFPYETVDFEKQLSCLSQPKNNGKPFIQRYEIESRKLIQIINWDKHQKPHHTEPESRLPPITPLKNKGNYKGKGKGQQDSPELRNGLNNVKRPLKSAEQYNCPFFIEFWNIYPKKLGKGKAWEEWIRVTPKPDEKMMSQIRDVIAKLEKTEQWKKNGGQFIPYPSTWIHQRRWGDEPNEREGEDDWKRRFLQSD